MLCQQQRADQSGRSLWEVIVVIVIIVILSLGGLWMYRFAIGVNVANTTYEDVLTQGEALRHRGAATNKNIYDSSIGTMSRTGIRMAFCPNESGNSTTPCPLPNSKFFDIKVFDVIPQACVTLAQKAWPSDIVALIKIGDKTYKPANIKCDVEDTFDLTITFWTGRVGLSERSDPYALPKLCTEGSGCLPNCEECENNVCVTKGCDAGEFCTNTLDPNGACEGCPPATEGSYCEDTPPSGVCNARGCCKKMKEECDSTQVCNTKDHRCHTCTPMGIGSECDPLCQRKGLACLDGAYCSSSTKRCKARPTSDDD